MKACPSPARRGFGIASRTESAVFVCLGLREALSRLRAPRALHSSSEPILFQVHYVASSSVGGMGEVRFGRTSGRRQIGSSGVLSRLVDGQETVFG